MFGFKDDLLSTPPFLGKKDEELPISPLFGESQEPMTVDEAEELVGDSWKKGTYGREQKRVKELEDLGPPLKSEKVNWKGINIFGL